MWTTAHRHEQLGDGRSWVPWIARRYARAGPSLDPPAGSLAADGTFASSDPLLDTIWTQSVATARLMVSPPTDLAPGCDVADRRAILDESFGTLRVHRRHRSHGKSSNRGRRGSPVSKLFVPHTSRTTDHPDSGEPGSNLFVDTPLRIRTFMTTSSIREISRRSCAIPRRTGADDWYPRQWSGGRSDRLICRYGSSVMSLHDMCGCSTWRRRWRAGSAKRHGGPLGRSGRTPATGGPGGVLGQRRTSRTRSLTARPLTGWERLRGACRRRDS